MISRKAIFDFDDILGDYILNTHIMRRSYTSL